MAGLKKLLGKGVPPDSRCNGVPLLLIAMQGKQEEAAAVLVKAGADTSCRNQDGKTPLHIAAGNGWAPLTKLLLKKGADPMAHSGNGSYPIHESIWFNQMETFKLLLPCYQG